MKRWRLSLLTFLLVILIAALAMAAAYGQDSCTETLTSNGTTTGEWAAGCDSVDFPDTHARFYTFALTEPSEVTIVLESDDADTFLYLRIGQAKSGAYLFVNDDDGSTAKSRIQEVLAIGTYTIEATTYSAGETGAFALTISGMPGDEAGPDFRLIFGPETGHFHHDEDRDAISLHPAYVDSYDVVASAIFENPYDATEHGFSYGFVFRSNGITPSVRFYVISDGRWRVRAGDITHEGSAPGLKTLKYEWNRLRMTVVGKYVVPSLNGVRLTDDLGSSVFFVGPGTESGDVYIGDGFVDNSVQDGAITHYDTFEVYRIIPEGVVENAVQASDIAGKATEQLPVLKSPAAAPSDNQ